MTGSTFLHRDLRDEKERAQEYKEYADAEVAKLVKNLRDTDAAQSDCQRELSRATAALEENARQILRLKQDREHWREEYFKLKENGPSPGLSRGVPAAPDARNNSTTSSQHIGTSSDPESPEPQIVAMCQHDLIDLSDESDTSPPAPSHAGPLRSQQSVTSRPRAMAPLPKPFIRLPKRTRVDDEFNSSPRSSFPPRKRRAGTSNNVNPFEIPTPGNIALGFGTRRKASSENRGLSPLHELLASAEDDDG